jgi:mRNA interferase YafQ
MLTPRNTTRFKKSRKRCEKRGYDIDALKHVMSLLIKEQPLPDTCNPHKLTGNLAGLWDCHIKFDWILLYRYDYEKQQIIFEDTGTHSDLF